MVETGSSGAEESGSWSAFAPTSNPLLPVVPRRPGAGGALQRRVWRCLGPGVAVRRPPAPAAPSGAVFPSSPCLPGPVRPGHSPVHACKLIALAPFSSGSIPLGLSDPPLPGASLPDSATRRGGTEEFGRAAESGGGGAGQQPFASAGRLPREGGTSREFLSDQRGKFPRSGRGRDCEVRRVHLSRDGSCPAAGDASRVGVPSDRVACWVTPGVTRPSRARARGSGPTCLEPLPLSGGGGRPGTPPQGAAGQRVSSHCLPCALWPPFSCRSLLASRLGR